MPNFQTPPLANVSFAREELPLRVREAAIFLGVSPQTVYLWVERKQIPHLRVMGRNIRFLKSELEPFVIPPIRWPFWPGDASKSARPADGSWPCRSGLH